MNFYRNKLQIKVAELLKFKLLSPKTQRPKKSFFRLNIRDEKIKNIAQFS